MLTDKQLQALVLEAERLELETILKFRPSELKRRGLDVEQVRRQVKRPATTLLTRGARQTGRGRKPGDTTFTAELAMLAVHFVQDGLTISKAITRAFHEINRARSGERLPINSTRRAEVRKEVLRRLPNLNVFISQA